VRSSSAWHVSKQPWLAVLQVHRNVVLLEPFCASAPSRSLQFMPCLAVTTCHSILVQTCAGTSTTSRTVKAVEWYGMDAWVGCHACRGCLPGGLCWLAGGAGLQARLPCRAGRGTLGCYGCLIECTSNGCFAGFRGRGHCAVQVHSCHAGVRRTKNGQKWVSVTFSKGGWVLGRACMNACTLHAQLQFFKPILWGVAVCRKDERYGHPPPFCRVDDADKKRAGRWASQGSSSALNSAYLASQPPRTLLVCGDWVLDGDIDKRHAFFTERMCVVVPARLLAKVYRRTMAQILASIAKVGRRHHGRVHCQLALA
jgi:hypothetical protein